MTSDLIKDVRVNLNRAQDYGQEALKNVERAHGVPDALGRHFENEVYKFACDAAHAANRFVYYCHAAATDLEQSGEN